MKKHRKKRDWPRILSIMLFLSLVGSIVFVSILLVRAPAVAGEGDLHTRGDYLLMLLQCTAGLVVMFLPSFIHKRFSILVPDRIYVLYLVFLYCAIYLGEVRNFYYVIPFWDSILHAFSGVMLGALGFTVVNLLNEEASLTVRLSPLFVSIFALCFAVTLGVLWEIYEFTFDGLLGLNMQKYALQGGEALAGRLALQDTMKDLIIDLLGALAMAIVGYFSIKKDRKWVLDISLRREKPLPAGAPGGGAEEPAQPTDPNQDAGERMHGSDYE